MASLPGCCCRGIAADLCISIQTALCMHAELMAKSSSEQGQPPQLQTVSADTNTSLFSGSSFSSGSGIPQVSPFAQPEAQLNPRESLDGSQPAQPALESRSPVSGGHVLSGQTQAPAIRPVASPEAFPRVQRGHPSGIPSGLEGSGHRQSGPRQGSSPGLQSPRVSGSSSTGVTQSPLRVSHMGLDQSSPTQIIRTSDGTLIQAPGHVQAGRPSNSSQGLFSHPVAASPESGNGFATPASDHQQHAQRQARQHDFPGSPASDSRGIVISPRVEDVLSGKSAATDRAALQELMDLKTPMQVS